MVKLKDVYKLKVKTNHLAGLILLVMAYDSRAESDTPYAYLDWYPRNMLNEEQLKAIPIYCPGDYIPPELSVPKGIDSQDLVINLSANESILRQDQVTWLQGSVRLQQGNRSIESDEAVWDQQTERAKFLGKIRFRDENMLVVGDSADADVSRNYFKFSQTEYVLHESHFRGSAQLIERRNEQSIDLHKASVTYCAPGQDTWAVKAKRVNLNLDKGFGSTYHTTLRIKDVPVLYFPYYRFPIDNKRHTGLLDPNLEIGGSGIQQASIPLYLNLAPNYDATITPRFLRNRGTLFGTEFRYLFEKAEGDIDYEYLNSDNSFDDRRRWLLGFSQEGNFSDKWSHKLEYNEVSDLSYFSDFDNVISTNRQTHLNRLAETHYLSNDWGFTLRAQSFQTIDSSIAAEDRPYKRLPQIELFKSFSTNSALKYRFDTELVNFTRSSDDLVEEEDKVVGQRFKASTTLEYPMASSWAYIKPTVKLNLNHYNLDDSSNAFENNITHTIPQVAVDSGLFFERTLNWKTSSYLQTLEPRMFYLYTPFEDQSQTPLFDTTRLTLNYDQLFRTDRFSGGDRIGDANQLSLGLTSRLISDKGEERLVASVGRALHFSDRRVDTSFSSEALDLNSSSAYFASLSMSLTNGFSVRADTVWSPEKRNTQQQRNISLHYFDGDRKLANLSYRKLDVDGDVFEADGTLIQPIDQVDFSFAWPVNPRLSLIGRHQIDLLELNGQGGSNSVLESMAGIEYDSCCWRTQLLYREWLDGDSNRDYGTFLQFNMKGLGALGSDIESLLTKTIPNYLKRTTHDY